MAHPGIAMVPERRRLFPSLTVEENLRIGAQGRKPGSFWTLDTVFDLFPLLRARRAAPGSALSGGQQQMVAIGQAPMSNPRVLLCDEISRGLAPVVILVEQDIGMALKIVGRLCCLMEGRVALAGCPGEVTRGDPRRPFRRAGMRRAAQGGAAPVAQGGPPGIFFPR